MDNEQSLTLRDSEVTHATIFKIRTYLQSMPDELLFDSDFRSLIELALGEKVGMNTFFRSALAEGFMISSGEKFRTFKCKRVKKTLIQKLKELILKNKGKK